MESKISNPRKNREEREWRVVSRMKRAKIERRRMKRDQNKNKNKIKCQGKEHNLTKSYSLIVFISHA